MISLFNGTDASRAFRKSHWLIYWSPVRSFHSYVKLPEGTAQGLTPAKTTGHQIPLDGLKIGYPIAILEVFAPFSDTPVMSNIHIAHYPLLKSTIYH